MKQLDKANLDEWIFDSLEGNLTEGEQEELNDYLSQNPDAKIEFEAWSNTYIKEPEIPFPGEDKLIRGRRTTTAVWMRWGLNVLAFILLCYLGLKMAGLFDSSDSTGGDKVENAAQTEEEKDQTTSQEASMTEDVEEVVDERIPLEASDITESQPESKADNSSIDAPAAPGEPRSINEAAVSSTANEDDPGSTHVAIEDGPTSVPGEQDVSNEGSVAKPPVDEDTATTPAVILAAATIEDGVVDNEKTEDPSLSLAGESSNAASIDTLQSQPGSVDADNNEANTSDSMSTEILSDNDSIDPGAAAIDTALSDGLDSATVEEVNKPDTTQQKKTEEKADSSKYPIFSVGPFLAYNNSKYRVIANNTMGDYVNRIRDLGGTSPFEYSAGINFNYRPSRHFSIETGVWYSQERTLDLALDTAIGVAFDYSGKYLEVPFRLKYHIPLGKVTLYTSAGVMFNFNFPTNTLSTYEHIDRGAGYKITLMPASAGINALAGVGVQYDVSAKLSMYIEPAYTYAFSPIVKHPTFSDVAIDHYTNTIGIGVGLFYKLN